jgi:hypothetical protein
MNAKELYLKTIDDLKSLIDKGDEYSLLRASGFLRQLLLDGLIHKVNRDYKVDLTFEVLRPTKYPPGQPQPVFQVNGLDPDQLPGWPCVSLREGQLLSIECLFCDGRSVSLKEVLKVYANTRGGVHLERPIKRMEEAVRVTDKSDYFYIGDSPSSQNVIRDLGKVVLRGLVPLTEAVKAG